MKHPVNQLRRAVEHEKDLYKNRLLEMGYFKTPEGKQLYELTLSELEEIYRNEKQDDVEKRI
jgi:Fur-regulated basic protein A